MQATYNRGTLPQVLAEPVRPPEWKRSGHFFVIAVMLHIAALAYPIAKHVTAPQISVPLTATLALQGVRSAQQAVAQATAPIARETPVRKQVEPVKPATPVLATQTAAPVATPAQPGNQAMQQSVPVTPATPPAQATGAGQVSAASGSRSGSGGEGESARVIAPKYNAAYLNNPPPIYPMMSRRMGEEGSVMLRVHVGADGRPMRVTVVQGSGFERLDDSALRVVQRWRFIPASRAGEAVDADVTVPIVFKLEDR